MNNMTPSQYIKAQGLPSLVYVAGKIGKDKRTLYKWYHNNFALFEVVVAGVKAKEFKAAMKGWSLDEARKELKRNLNIDERENDGT